MDDRAHRRPGRRWLRWWLIAAAALVGYRLIAFVGVRHADRTVERHADTGVMVGAEPLQLGPSSGAGAVLLVHGFVGASNNFGELPQRLAAAGWSVRALRLPGHGLRPSELRDVGPERLIEDVVSEVEVLAARFDEVVVVGHSMGGALATLVAADGRVDRLVLAAPYFAVTHRWYYGPRPETWAAWVGPALGWVYKGELFLQVDRVEAKPYIVSYDWIPTAAFATLRELGRRASDPERLRRVRCPVLLIHARSDTAASPEAAAAAVAAMSSEVRHELWLERSDHHLFWDHDRELALGAIERFLGPPPVPSTGRPAARSVPSPSGLGSGG